MRRGLTGGDESTTTSGGCSNGGGGRKLRVGGQVGFLKEEGEWETDGRRDAVAPPPLCPVLGQAGAVRSAPLAAIVAERLIDAGREAAG